MNEINRLWDKWAKDHSDTDVDEIITYYRKQLAMYDQGIKPKRAEAEQVDMDKILHNIKQRTLVSSEKRQVQMSEPGDPTSFKPIKGKGLRRI